MHNFEYPTIINFYISYCADKFLVFVNKDPRDKCVERPGANDRKLYDS